jgi:SAM-dependent MidA family methyltransferase
LQTLLSEAEMGELFKVIAYGRGVPGDAIGFTHGDRSGAL